MKVSIGKYPKDPEKSRKVIVEIAPSDTYSLDSTLALVIAPALKKFKEKFNDHPVGLTEDQWHIILDKMIWSFEQVNEDWKSQFNSGTIDHIITKLEDGSTQWDNGPNYTFDVDAEGMKAHTDKMQNGFDLFGKYYTNLWW